MSCPSYIMIGGFLGAGKTTASLQLAERLSAAGKRVGMITNDQSFGLVDTKLLAAHEMAVEEVTGGCICCRFHSLIEAAERLTSHYAPDVFFAEPVGSCTDLKATVDYPLRRLYGDAYRVAPYSVLVDPIRAARVLGLRTDKSFSEKVLYIYEKQLEEADLIVINKIDLIDDDQRSRLEEVLSERWPGVPIHAISARHEIGMKDWLDEILRGSARTFGAMEVDYDLYAEGESLLGWLNAAFRVTAKHDFDGNHLLMRLARHLDTALQDAAIEIAHLKMTLIPDHGNDLAALNIVRSCAEPELSHSLQAPLHSGELTLNLRAQGSPDVIQELVERMIAGEAQASTLTVHVSHLESFRPGRPVPIHRLNQA